MKIGLREKAMLYVAILILGFIFFDLIGLRVIYSQLLASDLDDIGLNHLRQTLFKMFLFKGLWLMITIGAGIGIGYWALKPYLKHPLSFRQDTDETHQA